MKKFKKTFVALTCLVAVMCGAAGFAACGEHEHSFSADWSSDSDVHWHECTQDGCGEKDSSAAHTYGDWQEVTAATEQSAGKEERTCSVCDYKQVRDVPALTPAAPAKHEHVWSDWTVTDENKPTESTAGKATRSCSGDNCDAAVTETEYALPALTSADYSKGNDTATCTLAGTVRYTYSADGVEVQFSVATSQKPHTMSHTSATPAEGCINGVLEHWHCTECGNDYADEDGETVMSSTVDVATGHKMSHVVADPATCTDDGVLEHWHCTACSNDFADEHGATQMTDTVDHAAHKLAHVEADHATCTDDGVFEHWHCTACGKDFEDESGETEMSNTVDPATGHTMSHVEADPATCTDDGVLEHWHCTACGKDFEDEDGETEMPSTVDPATGHAMSHVTADPATCTDDGALEHWHCEVCGNDYADENGATKMDSTVDVAKGHTMSHVEADPATCTDDGVLEHWHCEVCGKDFADANGKTQMDSTVDVAAHKTEMQAAIPEMCTVNGRKQYWHCAVCEKDFLDEACTEEVTDPEQLVVPASHKLTAVAAVTSGPASNKSALYPDSTSVVVYSFAHYKCSACGKMFTDEEAANEVTTVDYMARRGALISFGFNKVFTNSNQSGYAITYIADCDGQFTFTFGDGVTISAINYIVTGTKANVSPVPYSGSAWNSASGAYDKFDASAAPLTNTVTVNMEKGEWVTVNVNNIAEFTVNVEREPVLCYGENVIAVTQEYVFDVDNYKFTPEETKEYSITVPAGLSVDKNGAYMGSADMEAASFNFNGVQGEEIVFSFSSNKVGAYMVTIGEAVKNPVLTPDSPLNNLAAPARAVSGDTVSGGVTVIEVGAVEEGSYTLSIKLVSATLLRSVVFFAVNPDSLSYSVLTAASANGNVDTAASQADVIFSSMAMQFWKGAEEFNATWEQNTLTFTLNLKEGDVLAFAHNNGSDAAISVTLAKA